MTTPALVQPNQAQSQVVACTGRLTREPELRELPNLGTVCKRRTYRVRVTDQLTPGLASSESRHYESPPQSEQQARALLCILLGASSTRDRPGPWHQAIAGGQRIVELKTGS